MKYFQLNIPKILNLSAIFFPLYFILGNFFINLFILFFSALGIYFYKLEVFKMKKNNPLFLLILFFIFVIISTAVESLIFNQDVYLVKSILFLRYLFFIFVLRVMIIKNHLDLKNILISSLFFSSFVAIDVIFQYLSGSNFLGFKKFQSFAPGIFFDEPIAGGYIQKFAVLGFFALPWLFEKKDGKSYFICFGFLAISSMGSILSGNRMPTLILLLFLLLLIFFIHLRNLELKKISLCIFLIATCITIINNSSFLSYKYKSFYVAIPNLKTIIGENKKAYSEYKKHKNEGTFYQTETFKKNKGKIKLIPFYTGHSQVYITALDTFLDSPIMGSGIKSFRYTCYEKIHLPNRVCQNHPHNFYLEILNDVGVIGFVLIFGALFVLLYKNLKKFDRNKKINDKIFCSVFYALLFTIILEFFPLRSHGSFFSVFNSVYIFFILGILCGLHDQKNLKSKNNLKLFKFKI